MDSACLSEAVEFSLTSCIVGMVLPVSGAQGPFISMLRNSWLLCQGHFIGGPWSQVRTPATGKRMGGNKDIAPPDMDIFLELVCAISVYKV